MCGSGGIVLQADSPAYAKTKKETRYREEGVQGCWDVGGMAGKWQGWAYEVDLGTIFEHLKCHIWERFYPFSEGFCRGKVVKSKF